MRSYGRYKLSLALGYFKVEINIDSTMVVEAVESGVSRHIGCVVIFDKIKVLKAKLEEVSIIHSVREINMCTDKFALIGCNNVLETLIYNSH